MVLARALLSQDVLLALPVDCKAEQTSPSPHWVPHMWAGLVGMN